MKWLRRKKKAHVGSLDMENEKHWRSAGLSVLIQISRTPLNINHSLPLCSPYGNPYVHTQEPRTTAVERPFRFKSRRKKKYGFPLQRHEAAFQSLSRCSYGLTRARRIRNCRFEGHRENHPSF